MKKALIVSPYLDHLGGGERYMLSVASVVESLGYQIHFAWDNLAEINELSGMLGINLVDPQLDTRVKQLYFASNPLSMYQATKKYDLVVYLSDGSIPLLGGKQNILHMQVPFHNVGGRSLKNNFKKHFIHNVIVNSKFTKNIIDHEFGLNSTVLYPPVTPITLNSKKENLILSVGRFEPSLNAKKQDVLINAWKTASKLLPDWKLILAGASASEEWVAKLKELATNLPIEFAVNVSHSELDELYSKASIYWHAAGYGIDEHKNPELTEHFGISTVEAVSAGCIPLVIPYGGQREIVKSPELHWTTITELVDKTLTIIKNTNRDSYFADISIDQYSATQFAKNLGKILK